jgi:hypothetical protein
MWHNPARSNLRSSLDELWETIDANRRLRAELRGVMLAAMAASHKEPCESECLTKPAEPFGWWACSELEE